MERERKRKVINGWRILVFALVLVYTAFFSIITIVRHNNFLSNAFDLGIMDQALWLLSKGLTPFVTVNGLHTWGDHTRFILYLLVPFYWVYSDVRLLLVLQSLVLGLGALPIFWLAREKLKAPGLALVFATAYLFYPSLHYTNLFDFHPEVFAITFLLFAFYYLTKERYGLFSLFAFLALLGKEDVSLTVLALGIYVFFKHNRRLGVATTIVAVLWFAMTTRVIVPYFSGSGLILANRYAAYGGSFLGILKTVIFQPRYVASNLIASKNIKYLLDLLQPVGFLSLLSPAILALTVPALAVNLLSSLDFQHWIFFHYTYLITPFVFVSAIMGSAYLVYKLGGSSNPSIKWLMGFIGGLLVINTLMANFYLNPFSPGQNIDHVNYIWQIKQKYLLYKEVPPGYYAALNKALKRIPKVASVSASSGIVAHLSQRKTIYLFPNPFITFWYGVTLERPKNAQEVRIGTRRDPQYVILDTANPETPFTNKVLEALLAERYKEIFSQSGIILLKRL